MNEFTSLVKKYPCCPKLSAKGRECVSDLQRKGCIDRVLSFKGDGVYNGDTRFCSYSSGSSFPDQCYTESVYEEVPNILMPYGRVGNKTLHRDLGRLIQYQDMPSECKNQMTLSLYRLRNFGVRDKYSDTCGYVLDLGHTIDLNYMIDSVPLKVRTSQIVTLVLSSDDLYVNNTNVEKCDLRPQRINDLKRRYLTRCSLTEPRSNGIARSQITRVSPRFVATDLVSSDYMVCRDDKSVLEKREINYVICLIEKANDIIKKNEMLERQQNRVAYINSKERIYDYDNLIQILKSMRLSNTRLHAETKYKNLWIAERAIREWLAMRLGVIP